MEAVLKQKPIRILFITQWFEPEPMTKGLLFAKELMRQGFVVEVLTGFPNYPGGKLYPGYKVKLLQKETMDGVTVIRVPLYPSHDNSKLGRIANYMSFAIASLIYGLFFAKRADVIYAFHPPLTVGGTAGIIRLLRRIPLVYDIQDIWPDTLRSAGVINNEKFLSLVSLLCQWVYRRADKIAVLSPGFKKLLTQRKVSADKIEVIYNWCHEQQLLKTVTKLPASFPEEDKFRILFAGNIGKAQGLNVVIQAAELLQQQGEHSIVFVFLGGGVEVEKLQQLAQEKHLANTCFLPFVPHTEVGTLLMAADVLLVHLKKDALFSITIPSKTQAYMSIGKPILMAVDGDAADLVRSSGCGKIAISGDAQSIAETALEFSKMPKNELKKMGDLGREFYINNLALSIGASKFGKIFNQLIRKGS